MRPAEEIAREITIVLPNNLRLLIKDRIANAIMGAREEAIAALLKPAPLWRDISTAPKDGTKVLAFHKHSMTTISYWSRRTDFEPPSWHSQGGTSHIDQPTHWQPLPEPPKEEE